VGHRNLPEQIEHLRNEVDQLKQSLDQTLGTFEDLASKASSLVNEARQIADVLGEEPSPSGSFWGLLVILALGAGAVWLISPDTFAALGDFFKSQFRSFTASTQTH